MDKKITDITAFVIQQKGLIDRHMLDSLSLPQEKVYQIME